MNRGFPGGASGKESTSQCRRRKRCGFNPWVRKIPWRRAWQPTPVFLPGESHGQKSLAGYSPRGHRESDTTETKQQTGTANAPRPPSLRMLALDPGKGGAAVASLPVGLTQEHSQGPVPNSCPPRPCECVIKCSLVHVWLQGSKGNRVSALQALRSERHPGKRWNWLVSASRPTQQKPR